MFQPSPLSPPPHSSRQVTNPSSSSSWTPFPSPSPLEEVPTYLLDLGFALLYFGGGGRLVIAWMVLGHFFPMFKWTFSWVGGVKAIWALQKHMRTFLLVLPLHSPVATSLPLPISSISTTSISFSNILQVCEKAACRCSRQSSGLQRQERPHGMIDGSMQAGWMCSYQPGNFSWFYFVLLRLASKTKINLTIIRQWQIR